ncbi:putative SEP domain-containing protein [Zalerion maritima]|uniref:SEP domain-containing protein n=1 Tax=Zalerion maritima TaxID=339359 RepID=A0AAD5RWU2_9PEZI|nr:putative SEP domain-containing protein [Zalerion maritima]
MDHNELIQQFSELTGCNASQASEVLEGHQWNLESAITDYFQNQEEDRATGAGPSAAAPQAEPEYTGPRTLDGRPAPETGRQSTASGKKPQRRTGLATLGSLQGSNQNDDDDDDDDFNDEDDKNRRDLFAGGEKSGLAVQDPKTQSGAGHKKIIKDLLSKARENSERPQETAPASASRAPQFRGTGMVLGGDGVQSREIADPRGPAPSRAERTRQAEPQQFTLHIWEDGFSIDEGELRRFDDPANRADLEMIRSGRAPLHLMNVQMDQPVDVKLEQHQEKWRQLPKKYKPFGGEGHRLGSPVPGDGSDPPAGSSTAAPAAAAPPTSAPVAQPDFIIDSSQPTVNVRIQLPDGSRLPGRFNSTHTMGDLYAFLRRANASLSARPFVVATTFPNKDHTDENLELGDMPEFKKGGTAVVKWT